MLSTERNSFFEQLLKSVKWKFSEEEQLIIFDKLPKKDVSSTILLEKLIMKFGKKQPTGQKLVSFAWDYSKRSRAKIVQETHEGCNNCYNGFIHLPDLKAFHQYKYTFNMVNLTHFNEYTAKFPCICTGNHKFREHLKQIQELVFKDPELYEFCFIAMFGFCQEYLSKKRFERLDNFNPYDVWGIPFEPCHLVKPNYFKYVFEGGKPPIKKQELKRIPEYEKRLYD